ncbi:hypothetical protein HA402_005377 [Bradysia odoriphaga]|nr:hypothetical protein HA402_005377 [Bradysia odoriphaga]
MNRLVHKFWCIVLCLNCMEMFATSSPSDMLIIRHEFNSTVYEYDNDTMELNGNQSFYGDNSSDLFYLNGSGERMGSSSLSPSEYLFNPTRDNDDEGGGINKATVSTPKNKLAKKQIMANIRKTVEKGVEYLKSHAHLNKDNIEINSVMPTITENNSDNKDVNGNSLKSDNNNVLLSPLLDDIMSTSTSITQTKGNHVQNDDGEAHLRQLNVTPTSNRSTKNSTLHSSSTKYANNTPDDQHSNVTHINDTINKPIKSLEKHEPTKTKKSEMHIRDNKNNRIDSFKEKIDRNTEKPLLFDEKAFSDSGDYESESIPSGLYSENNEQANTEDDSQIGNFDLNENNDFSNVIRRFDEYVDLEGLDETSRNNRLNLLQGRDLLTTFLRIVETQHLLGSNCTAGTALNLGEGVVDRYAHDRFRVEAEIAVNRANMLTRIFKNTAPAVQESEQLLHASVLSMVEFDDDIFAAGNCFDWNQHPKKKGLFCPFAFRLPYPNHGASLAKDLAAEYHYLGNTSEWFFLARKNAERVIAKNEQYIKAYHLYSNSTEREVDKILSVKYEDGRWSKPYYDCGGGNIWMLTYTVPFFGHDNGTYFFKGTSGIDIDLRRVDIDQCPQKQVPGITQPLNIFAGTDKCKQRTTECEAITGLGFRRGSYKCTCRKGFYFPDTNIPQKYFNGSTLEEEYEKLMLNEPSTYSNPNSYHCLPCAEGCDACKDASPCVAALNWPMRTSILVLACAVIGFLPPAAYFTFRYQQVKVLRAASPALLRVIALGAFFIYCTSIVMYPNPSLYTCTARIWLREIGFSLTYGALMLKTWRISVIFRVRSAKAVKITDAALLKRLGVLCGCISVALLIRTIVAPPVVVVGRTADDLKAFLCKTNWWDHTFTSMEVLFLAWGVRLCIMVRKAPSEFNESRFISMAIYNEFLLTCFLNVSM